MSNMTKAQKREEFEVVIGDLESGMDIQASLAKNGIASRTFYNWIGDYPNWAEEKSEAEEAGRKANAAKKQAEKQAELLSLAEGYIKKALVGETQKSVKKTYKYVQDDATGEFIQIPTERVITESPIKLPDNVMLAAFNKLAGIDAPQSGDGEVMRPPDITFTLASPKNDDRN
jgi:transposase